MTDKEKAIRWFENIADECDKLTSGNVAHLRAQIKGMAIRSAEYLKKQEPASEDLEKESDVMATKLFKEFFPQDGDTITLNDFCKGLRAFAHHFTQWQRAQMTKDAVVIGDELVMCYNNGEPTGLSPYKEWWDTPEVQSRFKDGDKVKVIIVKDND